MSATELEAQQELSTELAPATPTAPWELISEELQRDMLGIGGAIGALLSIALLGNHLRRGAALQASARSVFRRAT